MSSQLAVEVAVLAALVIQAVVQEVLLGAGLLPIALA
jgi:hypothetical protein